MWAWRRLWAVLVNPLAQPQTREQVIARFVPRLPAVPVGQILSPNALPSTVDSATRTPLPVEWDLIRESGDDDVRALLQIVAAGVARLDHLDEVAGAAFRGGADDLGPSIVASRLTHRAAEPLPQFAAWLANMLFDRAERGSRRELQWGSDGRLRLPTRLQRVGDRLRLEGVEGSGSVSLRVEVFTSVIQQLGSFRCPETPGPAARTPTRCASDRWEELTGAGPPSLLRARTPAIVREALVLTYTCDLSFVEEVYVRAARAGGAVTSVFYDAQRITSPSEGPVDFLPVPVVCRRGGAFHPKLLVLAGDDDTVVAIGSGNATPSGWHYNAELWTFVRGTGATVPALFHGLGRWLRRS
ncbi:hypothetical protein [Cryptosporangium sp. NPDC051539]|uniref:hypothetical protein n=1 Tax=Cryptosporangium sp. NPDC051539 TaxID=3363962 RepID=UPI0037B52FBD